MTVCKLIFIHSLQICDDINIFCFSDFSHTPGRTSVVFNQTSKYNKTWYFSHKNRKSSVGKNGLNLRVKSVCCWHSWHISKGLFIIRQNVTVPVEIVGKLDKQNLTNSFVYLVQDECVHTHTQYMQRYKNMIM